MPDMARRHLLGSFTCVLILLGAGFVAPAQTLEAEDLVGIWTARFDTGALFGLTLVVREDGGKWTATIQGQSEQETVPLWQQGERWRFQGQRFPLAFNGVVLTDGRISGFIKYASYVHHVVFDAVPGARRQWQLQWNVLGTRGEDVPFDLYVDQEDNGVNGYLFFRQPTLPGCWTYGFEVDDAVIRFREKNMGLAFEGSSNASRDRMQLTVQAMGQSLPITFERIDQAPERQGLPGASDFSASNAVAPEKRDDGWSTAAPQSSLDVAQLAALVRAVEAQELTLVHSIVIARQGRLVFEEYFYGHSEAHTHDTRSASKTVATAIVGTALRQQHLQSVEDPVLALLRYRDLDHYDPRKAAITIEDCLRMASGLDANDSDNESRGSEWRYQSQREQPDWVRFALDLRQVRDPGEQPIYGSANPLIVGGVLQAVVDEPLEVFAHRTLWEPLGVERYKVFLDPLGNPYLGGGMHFRPRDLAKFGQMHLDGGSWNGQRVLDADYVEQSMRQRGHLDNVRDKNGYGYLWWHHQYTVEDKAYDSIEARGAGGQYICVLPELQMVVVINSGNYRNGRFRQPEDIMQRWIVPAAVAVGQQVPGG